MFWETAITLLAAMAAGAICWRVTSPVKPAYANAYLIAEDDSDMKIAGQRFPAAPRQDVPSDAASYVKAKQNGSIQKAEQLGQKLSEMINDFDFSVVEGVDTENSNVLVHLFLLCVFSIDHTLDQCFSTQVLAQVAQNKLIEHLDSKAVYQDIRVTGAYSMYKLAARSQDVPGEIGQAFAQLCLGKDDPLYAQVGSQLYSQIEEKTTALYRSMDFPDNQ